MLSPAISSHGAPAPLLPVLDSLSSGVMVLDADGVVLAANAAVGRILNLAPAWLTGRRIQRVPLPPAVRAGFPLGQPPRAVVIELECQGEGEAERRYRVHIAPLAANAKRGAWFMEWTDASEAHALRRAVRDNTDARDELQQAHEELRCAFELAETEVETSREQMQVHEALIEQLLRANEELMQANRQLRGRRHGAAGD